MEEIETAPRVSAEESPKILEEAFAYYAPLLGLVTGKPEAPEYHEYHAA